MNTDELYIATLKEQIAGGMYDHLFKGRSNLTFLDIGANIGLVSIYAVPYCKRIVAVEPSPETFPILVQNTKDYSVIERQRLALSTHNGEVDFYVNNENFTASSTVNTFGRKTTVEGITLNKLLHDCGLDWVDVCKVDIEGEEENALSLAEINTAKDKIKIFYIEVHNCPHTSWEHKLGTIVGNLARCGYHNQTINGMAITATRP